VFDPQPEEIDIKDIAHATAMNVRFNGHVHGFYSVAEHMMNMYSLVPDEHRMAALLHDASEAYLPDIPRPLKPLMNNFDEVEDRLLACIFDKFNIPYPYDEIVHKYDQVICPFEAMRLWPEVPDWCYAYREEYPEVWNDIDKQNVFISCLDGPGTETPEEIEAEYLGIFLSENV